MHRAPKLLLVWLVFATLACIQLSAQAKSEAKPQPAPPKLKVGDTAPDFTLLAYDGQKVKPVSLHDYRGKKNVALAFYVFAFTGG
jgi:cytochrome oxidase Cu insertion factor (SCO1/SenC/PrrC family)